ncbi:DNA helicase, partial [Clostridium perfringens]|nr:DNA helicase [Clostridium perfringens]
MALHEQKLLSKILDEDNFYILNRYNVVADDFVTEKETYDFIKSYVFEYKVLPDYRTVIENCEGFDYYPDVQDTFPFLCKQVKDTTAKRLIFNTLQKEAVEKFPLLNGAKFVAWIQEEVNRIAA